MVAEALLTSRNQEWETPPDFFDRLHAQWNFTVDACATAQNTKLERFWSPEQDGLAQSWKDERVWLNPPYQNRKPGQIDWVRKAYTEVKENGCEMVACLLPARTDTKLFHDYVMKAWWVMFVRGRLKFVGAPASAVFPSMVVIFHRWKNREHAFMPSFYESPPTFHAIPAKLPKTPKEKDDG